MAEFFRYRMIRVVFQGRLFDLMSYQPGRKLPLCGRVFALAVTAFAVIALAEPSRAAPPEYSENSKQPPATAGAGRPVLPVANDIARQDPDTDLFALMSGKCSTLRIAGREFRCRSVAFFHSVRGRADFTIALDDPADDSHVISFSGEKGQRALDNLYELPIDRMLLNSKDRPRVDGLPVPFIELSAGICKQLGNFAARQISSISCSAVDKNGKKYELHFESDGLPITVRRVRQSEPTIRHDFN
jgi:hypothetical protein